MFPIASYTFTHKIQVYDTDGNILQALDDVLLPPLLNQVFALLPSTPLTITELGCGTGRNTLKLLSPSLKLPITQIHALDLSPGMLAVARERCATFQNSSPASEVRVPDVKFYQFDALNSEAFPDVQLLETKADFVLSTLVLEHLPLDVFFKSIKKLLKEEGGYVVITNMHTDMGKISQAGFVDEETGGKVRGNSFVHGIQETLEKGKKWGFDLIGEVQERDIQEDDIGEGKVVGARGRKWIGVKCWFGFVLKLRR